LFTKFKKNNQIIFIDKNLNTNIQEGNLVDIVLSPRHYWVRVFTLPVSSVRDAQKLLPSLFEEFLPEGNFSYYCYFNEENKLIAFAYEDKYILELLEKNGIALSIVNSVRFIQTELDENDLPIRLDDDFALIKEKEILIAVPKSFVKSPKEIDFSNKKLSSHVINVQKSSLIDNKSAYIISALILFFGFLYLFEIYFTNTAIEKISKKKENIYKKYKLLSTTMQNKAILDKYKKIHKNQTKYREILAKAFSLRLVADEYLDSFKLEKGVVVFRFLHVKNKNKIISAFKKYNPKIDYKDTTLKVEIKL